MKSEGQSGNDLDEHTFPRSVRRCSVNLHGIPRICYHRTHDRPQNFVFCGCRDILAAEGRSENKETTVHCVRESQYDKGQKNDCLAWTSFGSFLGFSLAPSPCFLGLDGCEEDVILIVPECRPTSHFVTDPTDDEE